jgi:hypothetical protein
MERICDKTIEVVLGKTGIAGKSRTLEQRVCND